MPYRVGSHWGITIIWEGTEPPDEDGRRPDDRLLGMITDTNLALRVVDLLNADEK